MIPPTQTDPAAARRFGWRAKLSLSLLAPMLLLGLAEGGLRLAGFRHAPRMKQLHFPTIAGYDGTYEYRLPTFPSPPGYLWRTQSDTPFTDAAGFRRPALPPRPAPDRFRIAFLGGSTTQGQRHPFAERTIDILNAALHTPRYEALNAGCSSYSSHQSLLALRRWILDRDPDLVCVYHGWNDWMVASDGYSDTEKDRAASLPPFAARASRALIAWSRLAQGLARAAESLDRSWPRPRVSPAEFERNLRAMARLCARHPCDLVVFTRPPLALHPLPPSEPAAHEACLAIQRRVAATEGHVRLFEAHAVVESLRKRQQAGEFGPGAQVHQPDGLHLRPLGEQLLAEQLALALAPEHAEAIRAWLDSPAYALSTARRLLDEVMPREAAWFLRRIPPESPARPEVEALLAEARRRFEFADHFWQGCWGGSAPDFDSKIAHLRRCLEIRPDDLGVCRQLALVCFHMGRGGDAAALMEGFQPASPAARYEWAVLAFRSHVAARRLPEAVRAARLRLHLLPADTEAREFLRDAGCPAP